LLRGTDYELIGRARSGKEAIAQVAELKPDILLLDVNMPDGSGIEVLRQLGDVEDPPMVVLLTAGMDETQLLSAHSLRPDGMVLKTSDPALLLECIDHVRAGKNWVDPEIAERTRVAVERASMGPSLTPRERELIELVRRGLRNRDIAAELRVTEGTVKVYLHAIFDKVGADNRTELAMRAAELLGGKPAQ
jgi:two-component system nitrate/nitrite response regulator NarP